jgi:hypothetical protein
MKFNFKSKQYFPNYFIADVVIYATILWIISRFL